MIIGAGKMSRLLVKHLSSKNCKKMKILNRSLPRAEELAAEFPDCEIEIGLMDQLLSSVEAADTIFVASSSDDPLISKVRAPAVRRRESLCVERSPVSLAARWS